MSGRIEFKLKPGEMLGRQYRVLEFLGQGYEGEVYKVQEEATGIVLAAKLFYKQRNSKKSSPHIDYAKQLYQLRSCPIIIQYHHQDRAQLKGHEVNFLVSEFADGVILSDYLKRQPQKRLQPFEALHLFYALVKGVEKIHSLNKYHGDIHMGNIIIRKKGLGYEVNLIDLRHIDGYNKLRIKHDVIDLITIFYEMLGGCRHYRKMPSYIKKIILGRKHSLIEKKFRNAGHLRLFLENIDWE